MVNPVDTLDNGHELSTAVQCLVRGTSEKFVAEPSKEQIASDLLIGLKRFKESPRWKYFFMEEKKNLQSNNPDSTDPEQYPSSRDGHSGNSAQDNPSFEWK